MTSTPLLMRQDNGNKNFDPRKRKGDPTDLSGRRQVNIVYPIYPISISDHQNENVLKRNFSGDNCEVPLSPMNQVNLEETFQLNESIKY